MKIKSDRLPHFALAAACAAIILFNFHSLAGDFRRRIKRCLDYSDTGRFFACGKGTDEAAIYLAEKNFKKGTRVFYWTFPFLRRSASIESEVMPLNYYLYPYRFYYRNAGDIEKCGYLICRHSERKRMEAEMSGFDFQACFAPFAEDDEYVIFRRIKEK